MKYIKITNAREGNLKNISLDIPKNKIVVFTGVSGSGKSTLLVDVIYNECQRQYLEAMSFQGIKKPKAERIQGASPAIMISQTDVNKNPRSTVGTMTDVYTGLRMIYEKLGIRSCPYCGEIISSADCREETEKIGNEFYVYMYCCKCAKRMDKITRTYFSFNTREGACEHCGGLGEIHSVNREHTIDEELSLEEGAVKYWEKQYGLYQISVLYKAFQYYSLPVPRNIPVKQFDSMQKAILYEGVESQEVKNAFFACQPPKTAAAGRFEGVFPILRRRLSEKNGNAKQLEKYFDSLECPACNGERLGELSRNVNVHGIRLPELAKFSLDRLYEFTMELSGILPDRNIAAVHEYLLDIKTKLNRFIKAGLGYLTLDRQIITLSGGELQRLRLAAALDSELTGVIYILDEPTAGLHPSDTAGMMAILKSMRNLGNSVFVIEHDIDVISEADYIVDIGPGAGRYGGEIIAAGTLEEIKRTKASVTGNYLFASNSSRKHEKKSFREAAGEINIKNAEKFNLKNISVTIPAGCLVAVTGPSGSGKSTLIFEVLAKGNMNSEKNRVTGLEQFDRVVLIEQASITKMRRSNVATNVEIYSEIRAVFAGTQEAKHSGFTSKHFSFNTPGGRCENCEGLGYVENNLLFFANSEIVCPACGGRQFKEEVLEVKYKGNSIKDILNLSVDEAFELLKENVKIAGALALLQDVGLGYLLLGQSLTTLSGGEGQRLKLARELTGNQSGKRNLYLMDEPSIGLHPQDIKHFLVLLERLADAGNTVVFVEHNQQMIRDSDWIIDLGPSGGDKGGYVIFQGTKTS